MRLRARRRKGDQSDRGPFLDQPSSDRLDSADHSGFSVHGDQALSVEDLALYPTRCPLALDALDTAKGGRVRARASTAGDCYQLN